ncbi:hypothetical protein RhiirA4_457207 [Rhizophagus irregularis]|uniref:Uncharacterized protein n=1 Tax=Rhizophagus irregularis TaxID=588596 RepID=A0A2I1G9F6_9GLOM|nr:hypothetical protein RhiirA4_457207 [Rhizophagus irregularis]
MQVQRHLPLPKNRNELWVILQEEWLNIEVDKYQKLTNSSSQGTTLSSQENLLKKKLLEFGIKTKRMMSELGIITLNITEKEIMMENNELGMLKVILSSNDVEEKEDDDVSKDDDTSSKLSINMDNKK